jgi:hypothetical protein
MPGIFPFEFSNPVSTTPGRIITTYPRQYRFPIFSNNAQVYYKPASQSATGVGSVRNSSRTSRRL